MRQSGFLSHTRGRTKSASWCSYYIKHSINRGHAVGHFAIFIIRYIWTMNTLQVNILNPKAVELLKHLADLNLISIQETGK